MPRKMNTPSPPAPMAAAMVAVPIVVTVAMRRPAMMVGAASGQFHHAQNLPARHSHRDGGIAHHRIDAENSGDRVAQDRQQRIEHQRDDRGVLPDAADERDRNQKAEQREAGDGLADAGESERPAARRAGCEASSTPAGMAMAEAIRIALRTSTRCSPSSCEAFFEQVLQDITEHARPRAGRRETRALRDARCAEIPRECR